MVLDGLGSSSTLFFQMVDLHTLDPHQIDVVTSVDRGSVYDVRKYRRKHCTAVCNDTSGNTMPVDHVDVFVCM